MTTTKTKPTLQLSGIDGNVFGIIAAAKRAATRYNRDVPDDEKLDFNAIQKEAMSGDYDHVIQTFMKHFEVH